MIIFFPLRNRAIDGDSVVVEILPRSEWHSRKNTLPPEEGEEKFDENVGTNDDRLVCCGKVVKIIERSDRSYVASFEVSIQECSRI